jgi:hypothetical protein
VVFGDRGDKAMAKPEKIRITLNEKNEMETVEVMLGGKWVETEDMDCCDAGDREDDAVIRVGAVAEPNSCTQDPRCPAASNYCTIYIGGVCKKYTC